MLENQLQEFTNSSSQLQSELSRLSQENNNYKYKEQLYTEMENKMTVLLSDNERLAKIVEEKN